MSKGLSDRPAIIARRPDWMRLAIATTPRESKLSGLISSKYRRTGSSVPSDADAERAVREFVRRLFVHFGPLGSFDQTPTSSAL
jgi:hypothetical protein